MGTYTARTSTLIDMLMNYKDEHDLSDRELAERLGVSHGSPSNWRRGGKVDLDITLIRNAAELLDVEDWQVPLLYYGVDGPGPTTANVAGASPRSPQPEKQTEDNVVRMHPRLVGANASDDEEEVPDDEAMAA